MARRLSVTVECFELATAFTIARGSKREAVVVVATIEEAAEAGLVGIGLSAGHALVIGVDDVAAAARARGIFLWGWTPACAAEGQP